MMFTAKLTSSTLPCESMLNTYVFNDRFMPGLLIQSSFMSTGYKIFENSCILEIALQKKDVSLCKNINFSLAATYICISQIAVENVLLCDEIPELYMRSRCIADVALAQKDISLCEKIKNNASVSESNLIERGYEDLMFIYNYCIQDLKNETNTNAKSSTNSKIGNTTNPYCPNGECDEKEKTQGICPQDCGTNK